MAGKNDLFLTLSKTCGRVSSQQGAPTTCNLTYGKASQQTFVRTLMASLGVVVGQYWDVQWGREEMRLDNGCGGRAQFTRSVGGGGEVSVNIAILDVKYPQTPRIVFFPRTVSFQGHFITSTSPNQQKIARRTDILSNRSIGCAPVQGLQYYFSKSLVAIYRFTNVRIFLIPF